MKTYFKIILLLLFCMVFSSYSYSQEQDLKSEIATLKAYNESLNHQLDKLFKKIDDITWFQRVNDYLNVKS